MSRWMEHTCLAPQPFLGNTSTSRAPSHATPSTCQHPAEDPILQESMAFTVTSLVMGPILLLMQPHIYMSVFSHAVGVSAANVKVTLVRQWPTDLVRHITLSLTP